MSKEYSNKQFWDDYWAKENRSSYDFLFSEILDRYLDWDKIQNYVEIGGAPGTIMSYMFHEHNIQVNTVDFCESNILSEHLTKNRVENYNIYNEDFSTFNVEPHRKKYDLVASWGFIEHFEMDVSADFIRKHKEMVSDNGYLIVELPNIRGFNWLLYKFMNLELLKIHNLKTMDLNFIRRVVEEDKKFEVLYGNYYLTSFLEYSSANEFFERHKIIKGLFGMLKRISRVLHINNLPNRLFSPYIIFIARRVDV